MKNDRMMCHAHIVLCNKCNQDIVDRVTKKSEIHDDEISDVSRLDLNRYLRVCRFSNL